jgi:dTMP kinase
VVFEGGEGAGKTTQVRKLAERLRLEGLEVLTTREPGGTRTAEEIRTVLLSPVDDPMSPRCEALLFAAARADHVAKVIDPALDDGILVISDRYLDSSLAYQGFARELPVDEVAEISRWATLGLVPDLTVVLDLDPRQGLARAVDGNRMEAQPAAFHTAVRVGLLTLAAADPDRYLVLDATADPESISHKVVVQLRRMVPTLGREYPA